VVPWPQILAGLVQYGYDDVLSIELEYRWHRQDLPAPEDGFRESGAVLRAMLSDPAQVRNAR
jgi:L-ribulose-5-phosphate 3-epimerase